MTPSEKEDQFWAVVSITVLIICFLGAVVLG